MKTAAPRVVLVEPENPLNVGFVARAMRCFGASELTIVGPGRSLPGDARKTGSAALEILDSARFVSTLAEALRGCDAAVAFSRRPTSLRQASFDLPELPAELADGAKTALVFGRESTGLTAAEFALCPWRARIPCREGLSLNLGQAAAVALHSFANRGAEARPSPGKAAVPLDRMLSLWEWLEPRLTAAPRFTPARLRRVRQMLYRLRLDDDDFGMLYASFRALGRE